MMINTYDDYYKYDLMMISLCFLMILLWFYDEFFPQFADGQHSEGSEVGSQSFFFTLKKAHLSFERIVSDNLI